MTGLDKIVSQILDDADEESSGIIRKAQDEAAEIIKSGEAESRKLCEEGERQRIEYTGSYRERIKSSADLKKRQAVLLAKQEIITDMLNQAYESLLSKTPEEYFVLIRKMIRKFALAKQGEIYFSKKDLDRILPGFEAEIEEIAASVGGSLKLIKEAKNIDGGFILVYGGVEENCSFKALMSARKDELSDQVHEMLFS